MKKKILVGISVAAVLFAASQALAAPFIYEVIQPWSYNDSTQLYGTAADLLITVDNGNTSAENQTFTWDDITDITFQTVGGTFTLNSSLAPTNFFNMQPVPLIQTDNTGSGIFTIPSTDPDQYIFTYYLSGQLQAKLGSGSYSELSYSEVESSQYAWFQPTSDWNAPATWLANEKKIPNFPGQPVPEPMSIVLFGTGLVGLAGTRIRRKKKA